MKEDWSKAEMILLLRYFCHHFPKLESGWKMRNLASIVKTNKQAGCGVIVNHSATFNINIQRL